MNKVLILYRVAQITVPLMTYLLTLSKLNMNLLGEVLIPIALASFLGNVFNQNLDNYFSSIIFGKRLNKKHPIYFSIILGYKLIFSLILFLIWIVIAFVKGEYYWFFAIYTAFSTMLIPHFYISVINKYGLLITGFFLEKIIVFSFVYFYIDNVNYKDLNAICFFGLLVNLVITYYLIFKSTNFPVSTKAKFISRLIKRYKVFLIDSRFFVLGKITQSHTDLFKFLMGTIFGPVVVVSLDFLEKVINSQKAVISLVNNHYQYKIVNIELIINVLAKVMLLSIFILCINMLFVVDFVKIINENLVIKQYQIFVYSLILLATPIILLVGQNYSLRHTSKTYVARCQVYSNILTLLVFFSLYIFNAGQDILLLIPLIAEMSLAILLIKVLYKK